MKLANLILVQKVGWYLPFAILGGITTVLGSGLLSTLTPTSSVGVWIVYQIILGAGRGFAFQIPLIAVQNHSSKEEVSIVNALATFAQNFGAAIFISLDQVLFSSGLRRQLKLHAPEINVDVVIAAGAAGIHGAVPASSVAGVQLAYSKSYDNVMYLATGAGGLSLIAAFGMGWVNIKRKAEAEKAEAEKVEKVEKVEKTGTQVINSEEA